MVRRRAGCSPPRRTASRRWPCSGRWRSAPIRRRGRCWAGLVPVLVRPGRDRLSGTVEADETYIGGEEAGLAGGRARGKKVLTGIAVEVSEPRGIGRCRMQILRRVGRLTAPLRDQLHRAGREGDHRRMDGLPRPRRARLRPRAAQPRAARARGEDPGKLLPAVHRVASLAKRWLLSTHQGSVDEAHLQATWTSSCSASTAAARAAAAWSSTGSSSSPPAITRCATATSLPASVRGRSRRSRQRSAGIRRAWSGRQRNARGGPLTCASRLSGDPAVHYPERVVMPMRRRLSLAAGVPGLLVSA